MKIKSFLKENKLLIIAYLLATVFFIYQRYKILNWDFIVYILNAKYLFSQGNYFEFSRYPLPSILLGIFSLFTWKIAPHIYIIFVSFLHLFSSIKLAEKFNIDKNLYYLISLMPFLLLEGLKNGTELLSLSLMQLFLAYFNTNLSGIFFGLSFLSRYTSIILLPLIIFLKKPKKILIFLIIFLLILSPWLIFNYIKTGNALLSIADSYALNVRFRDYIDDKFPIYEFLISFNYILILFLIGFVKKIKKFNINDIMMLIILILTLIGFYSTPVKSYTLRYIFLMIIPLTYFSVIALKSIKKEFIFALFIISLIISFSVTAIQKTDKIENYGKALPYLNNCSTYSNNWVYLNYLGKNTKPDLYKEQFKSKLENGERILMFYNNLENPHIKNKTFLRDLSVIEKNENFILFGDEKKCEPEDKKIDIPYIINRQDTILEVYNYTEDISNCYIFFKGKIPLIC